MKKKHWSVDQRISTYNAVFNGRRTKCPALFCSSARLIVLFIYHECLQICGKYGEKVSSHWQKFIILVCNNFPEKDWTICLLCSSYKKNILLNVSYTCRTRFLLMMLREVKNSAYKGSPPRVRISYNGALRSKAHRVKKADRLRTMAPHKLLKGGFFVFFLFMFDIQHCFICHHSDSTVSEDAGIEPEDSCDYGTGCQTLYPLG